MLRAGLLMLTGMLVAISAVSGQTAEQDETAATDWVGILMLRGDY